MEPLMAKTINILGATGSIGTSTLDLVKKHADKFQVRVLTANSNAKKLAGLAKDFRAEYVCIADENQYEELKILLSDTQIKILTGKSGLIEAASIEADITMAAIVGTAGLEPTLAAIKQGNIVAFASKECLVAAGSLMIEEVKKHGTKLLPVDSEHNAIYQVFEDDNKAHVNRLILTASGGPFREWSKERIACATPKEAVNHPNWSMGAKISVDSATLMNKALEVIEAVHLFDMPSEKVDVVVHPQSLIHSMVEYNDGSILSQMGPADMRTPIAYCLGWPERIETSGPLLDLIKNNRLDFIEPDLEKFPSLAIVRDVLQGNQSEAVKFNAANEICVTAFLHNLINFYDIMETISRILQSVESVKLHAIEDVIAFDEECRIKTREVIDSLSLKHVI